MPSERTPLTSGEQGPPYIFVTNPNRVYRKQIREFQCCVCATILLIVLTALIASITYSVDNDDVDVPTNNSAPVASNLTLLGTAWTTSETAADEWRGPTLTLEQIRQAVSQAEQEMTKTLTKVSDGPSLPVDSPSYRHQQSIRTSVQAIELARSGLLSEAATRYVSKNLTLKGSIGKGPTFKSCKDRTEDLACTDSPYRTYDGLCNNKVHKTWGAAMQAFKRDMSPDYADGISAPRAAQDGSKLPSARQVSVTIHRPVYRDDPKFTVMLAVWGQFMDHDVSATALTKGSNGSAITCCGVSKDQQNPACFPVELDLGDEYYHKYNMTCMEFVRSSPAPACTLGPREQLNQVSSFLDASVVYGNSQDLALRLRTFQNGELKMFRTPDGRELLPVSTDPLDGCNEKEQNAKGRYCFMTGDARANENTHLTSMHLLLARQHNTLARHIARLNPDWDDETLYQESRRILAAQMQHITYNEFLPIILGPSLMTQLKLSPVKSGYSSDYNAEVDTSVSNNFATSAFRFAHTLIPSLMKVIGNDTSSVEYVELHKMLFNPYEIYSEQGLDKTLQGAMNTNIERADNYFTTQLTQHLFEQVGSKVPYGLDLVSLNIQRGRDHGLPGYTKWRKYCGLSEVKSFDDLKNDMDEESLQLLAKIYTSVEDIDMYTGGLSEKPVVGGMLGATMTCLIAKQFVQMKMGDRYWYETLEQPQAFTPTQLEEIRKTSLAGIICQNSDHVTYSQHKVMELVSAENLKVSCTDIAQPDLTQWISHRLNLSAPAIPSYILPINVAKFGSKVLSGSIELNNEQKIWDGSLPVEIPLSEENRGHRDVTWSSILKTNGMNAAVLSGHFSSLDGNGTFSLNLQLLWNTSTPDLFNTFGNVTVIFADRKIMSALPSAQLLGSPGQHSKVILFGDYVKNNTAFVWNGNITCILFESVKIDPSIYFQTKSSNPLVLGLMDENPAFGVSNGHLSVNNTMLWSGVTPVLIPVNNPLDMNKTHAFGYMANFQGVLQGNSFVGNFSIPNYKTGIPSMQGEISLELIQLNIPVSNVLLPNVHYNAKILFRESDGSSILDWARNGVTDDSRAWNWFLTSSKDTTVKNIAIVLQGVYSADKLTFSWSGNFIVYSHEGVPLALTNSNSLQAIDNDKDKSKADDKANKGLVYGVHVSYLSITGGFDGAPAETLYEGSFPAMLYIGDVFDGVAAWMRSIPVTWRGQLTGNVVTGNYSTQFKGRTLTGSFSANIYSTFAFTPFPTNLISQGTEYTTTVSFKQYNSLSASANTLTLPTRASSTSMTIVGTFSPDSTSFYFPGDFTFTVGGTPKPDADPQPNSITLGSSGSTKNKKKEDQKKKDDKKKKGESIGAMVKYAQVTAGVNGTSAHTVFDGKPPLMTDIGNMFTGLPPWQRSINVLWTAKISGNQIDGNYSTVIQGKLYGGSFTAYLTPMWVPTLDLSLLKSNTYYSTAFLFTQWGKSSGSFAPIEQKKTANTAEDSMLKLFSSAQQLTLGSIDSSVIIVGTFSPDGTSFYWPGSVRFIKTPPASPVGPVPDYIPKSTEKPSVTSTSTNAPITAPTSTKSPSDEVINLELSKSSAKVSDDPLPEWYKGKLIAKVMGGFVSAALENRPMEQWWYEFLPVDLPFNPFWTPTSDIAPSDNSTVFSHGIIWSASYVGEYNIQGSFSMPQYVRSNGALYTVQWYNGDFNFRFSPLWNSLIASQLVELNVKYYSPLHFQSTTNPILQSGPSQDIINSARPAPIILLGNYTTDKFSWSGSAIIAFK